MEQLFLMPGEERCERFKDGNGIPRVHYSYRSMHGAFFDCESRSLEEAQRLCEDWLVGQDRCYRNWRFDLTRLPCRKTMHGSLFVRQKRTGRKNQLILT